MVFSKKLTFCATRHQLSLTEEDKVTTINTITCLSILIKLSTLGERNIETLYFTILPRVVTKNKKWVTRK